MRVAACVICLIAVILGAMGAHAFEDTLHQKILRKPKVEDSLEAADFSGNPYFYDKLRGKSRLDYYLLATRYLMFHGLALLALSSTLKIDGKRITIAMLLGCVLFSGSLYLIALTGKAAWATLTPIGGAAFIVGWVMAILAIAKEKKTSADSESA